MLLILAATVLLAADAKKPPVRPKREPASVRRVVIHPRHYPGRRSSDIKAKDPAPAVQPEDKLKDLVISPTYEKDKVKPKMIEIPS